MLYLKITKMNTINFMQDPIVNLELAKELGL
jgi:hypothetical protein